MATWSSKRKFIYAIIAMILVAVCIGFPAWKILYVPPSCVDNRQNGDEQGIDCGGSCTKVCQNAFLPLPSPSWVRFKQIVPKTYNAAAYIVNPNPKAGAKKVPYTLEMIDANGLPLSHMSGTFDIAPGRNTLVFAGPFSITTQTPVRATFTVDRDPVWYVGNDPLPTLAVTSKNYVEASTTSSLNVTLKNTGPLALPALNVYAILTDTSDNVIDFSRTVVDGIAPAGSVIAPFTWPYSHAGSVISIEVLSVPE
jgi:hypothetical protein